MTEFDFTELLRLASVHRCEFVWSSDNTTLRSEPPMGATCFCGLTYAEWVERHQAALKEQTGQ